MINFDYRIVPVNWAVAEQNGEFYNLHANKAVAEGNVEIYLLASSSSLGREEGSSHKPNTWFNLYL